MAIGPAFRRRCCPLALLVVLSATCLAGGRAATCPRRCACIARDLAGIEVDCTGRNLTELPSNISSRTTILDLSMNNILELPDRAFSKLNLLMELKLADNQLTDLPRHAFYGLTNLKELHLQGNRFESVPAQALRHLWPVDQLHLDANLISAVPPDSFVGMYSLKQLWLNANRLKEIPVLAINQIRSLEALTLATNEIREVPDYAFQNMTNLAVLLLHDNKLDRIEDRAFEGLPVLQILELNRNQLTKLPVALQSLPDLMDLTIADNLIEYLPDFGFAKNPELASLELRGNKISSFGTNAFSMMPKLDKLVVSEAWDQTEFPDLTGTHNLAVLQFDRANIRSIPSNLCQLLRRIQSLDVHSNKISQVPDLSECRELHILNVYNNKITSLQGQPFRSLHKLRDLILGNNYVTTIYNDSFVGLERLEYLDLVHNQISHIEEGAFLPTGHLVELNLGENQFSKLPTAGLQNLKKLLTYNNKNLQNFPPPSAFPKIQLLTLSYAYHCCEFIHTAKESSIKPVSLKENIIWLRNEDSDWSLWQNLTNIWRPIINGSIRHYDLVNDIWDGNFGKEGDFNRLGGLPPATVDYLEDYMQEGVEDIIIAKPPVKCIPMPDAFLPCDDLFGWWSLRCGVWVVFQLALVGNAVVLFVSITSKSKIDVPRFLICNLACADLFMGIFLGILAVVDASSLGEFKKFAIRWQMSPGCLVAGFMGILSSELSVYTLTVISLERFYVITHAMQLNKRLSLKRAGYIMLCGWIFSIVIACLPLFGVSDYRKFAVCLPFETGNRYSLGYVCFIMIFNGLSFLIIVSCYMKMYCAIRDSQAWNSNEFRVAKRMALLIFTDFACWMPITVLSLTAVFGKELISLNEAKLFTIFVLPLNSCANPFLYAIFTKQFKKDCVNLCKRLEESTFASRLSRVGPRNFSMSWMSLRKPSGLMIFLNDKRGSYSNSASGGSGSQNYNNADINIENKLPDTAPRKHSDEDVKVAPSMELNSMKDNPVQSASIPIDVVLTTPGQQNPEMLDRLCSDKHILLHVNEAAAAAAEEEICQQHQPEDSEAPFLQSLMIPMEVIQSKSGTGSPRHANKPEFEKDGKGEILQTSFTNSYKHCIQDMILMAKKKRSNSFKKSAELQSFFHVFYTSSKIKNYQKLQSVTTGLTLVPEDGLGNADKSKSNSLVELFRQKNTKYAKRFSWPQNLDDYTLLSDGNRDSAFVEDDDDWEQDPKKNIVRGRSCSARFPARDLVLGKDEESTQLLHFSKSDDAVHIRHKDGETSLANGQTLSNTRSDDQESGFNSET